MFLKFLELVSFTWSLALTKPQAKTTAETIKKLFSNRLCRSKRKVKTFFSSNCKCFVSYNSEWTFKKFEMLPPVLNWSMVLERIEYLLPGPFSEKC